MDDPLLLERYRLMQSSALAAGYPYNHPAAMMAAAHPSLSPYLGAQTSRYPPADMLAQMGYPYGLHPGAKLSDLSPGAAERYRYVRIC